MKVKLLYVLFFLVHAVVIVPIRLSYYYAKALLMVQPKLTIMITPEFRFKPHAGIPLNHPQDYVFTIFERNIAAKASRVTPDRYHPVSKHYNSIAIALSYDDSSNQCIRINTYIHGPRNIFD
jgi:hypothetical protein